MARSKVAILRTTPATVLADYHRLLNLAGYQDVIAKDADTALKINISWHFFYPSSSTTPWQLDGVIRALKQAGAAGRCHPGDEAGRVRPGPDPRVPQQNRRHRRAPGRAGEQAPSGGRGAR